MTGNSTGMIFDQKAGRWVPNPNFAPDPVDTNQGPQDDVASDSSQWDSGQTPSGQISGIAPANGPALPFMDGKESGAIPSARGRPRMPGSVPSASDKGNYNILKSWGDPPGPGLAFDANRAARALIDNHNACGDHYGRCQHAVWTALRAGGMDVQRFPSAKNMIPYLSNNKNFSAVASGLGNRFDSATSKNYHPQLGDICVWQGGPTGPHGHIQMCVGFRKDGSAVYMSDFEAKESNFSGMRDPVGHGGNFVVFRQHTVTTGIKPGNDAKAAAPDAKPTTAAAPQTIKKPPAAPATVAH